MDNEEKNNIEEQDRNMQDQNNEQNEIEKIGKQIGNKAKENAKDAAKTLAREAGKKIGEVVKKAVIELLKAIPPEAWLIIIAVILVIVLLVCVYAFLKTSTFDEISDMLEEETTYVEGQNAENNSNNTNQNNNSSLGNARKLVQIEDRQLKLNTDQFFQKITNWAYNNKMDLYALGISKDYSELKTFLEAEVATFYPDLRERALIGTEVPEGELQGCVQFVRKYGSGTSDIMEYMPYEEYAAEVAKMGLNINETNTYTVSSPDKNTKAGIEGIYNNIKDNFTLDENQNLVLVKLNSTEVIVDYDDWANAEDQMYKTGQEYSYTYTISKELINYQTVLESYSMPFELCLALLISTENSGFAKEVANLAKNSSIVIDVQDNEVETEYKYVYGHTSDYHLETHIKYYYWDTETVSASSAASEQSGGHASGVVGTTTRKRKKGPRYLDLSDDDIKRIDDYETITVKDYSTTTKLNLTKVDNWIADINILYEYKPEESNEGPTTTQAGENDATYTKVPAYHEDELKYPSASDSDWVDEEITHYCSEKRYNKTVTFTSNRKTKQYNEISRDIKESPDKFLSLLKVDPATGKFDLYNFKNNTKMKTYKKANGTLQAVGYVFANEKESFFELIESNTKTKDLKETMLYLMNLYKGKTTYDESRFSMYEPGNFRPVGSWTHYGNNLEEKVWFALKDLGYSDTVVAGAMGNIYYESGGFSPSAVEGGSGNGIGLIQWSFGRRTQLETYAASKGVPWQDEDTQIEFLVAELSGQGPAAGYATRRTCGYIGEEHIMGHASDWENATTVYDATLAFMRFFESPKSKSSLTARNNKAQEYYDRYQGMERPSGSFIIDTALKYVGYPYVWGGSSLTGGCDCSHFVWLVLKECGVISNSSSYYSTSYMHNGVQNDWGATYIGTDVSQAQAGDIILYDGHTALYKGDGTIVEAQGSKWGITDYRSVNCSTIYGIYRFV